MNIIKALYKEQLLKAIEDNFSEGVIIFEDNETLKQIWEQLGHDWHIEDGRWQETHYNDKWKDG